MEVKTRDERRRLNRAKKRIEELKGFYWHLAAFLGVNLIISFSKIGRNLMLGESLAEGVFDFGTFSIWFFWGIGLAFHAAKVFGFNPFFGKDWEENQIQKYIENEKKEAEKYR